MFEEKVIGEQEARVSIPKGGAISGESLRAATVIDGRRLAESSSLDIIHYRFVPVSTFTTFIQYNSINLCEYVSNVSNIKFLSIIYMLNLIDS